MGRLVPRGMLLTLLLVRCASAATYIVTDTNDTLKVTSLRGAIIAANHLGGNNTIILGDGLHSAKQPHWVYTLDISGQHEYSAQTGDLNITRGHLTISSTKPNVTIDASALGDRVFQVSSNAQLTLKNLNISGGTAPWGAPVVYDIGGSFNYYSLQKTEGNAKAAAAPSPSPGDPGGAIYNAGVLSLENCVVTNNSAGGGSVDEYNDFAGGGGGGVYNNGTFTAQHCIFAGNFAGPGIRDGSGGWGGGIKNDGTCVLTDCVVSENQSGLSGQAIASRNGGKGGSGGGICNFGKATLTRCFVGANRCGMGTDGVDMFPYYVSEAGDGGSGGGIYNTGQLQVSGCTIYGNVAGSGGNFHDFPLQWTAGTGGDGGGIFNSGKLAVVSSTISGNAAGLGGSGYGGIYASGVAYAAGGTGGGGGGVYNLGTLQLTSCTIVSNASGAGGFGSSFSSGYYGGGLPEPDPAAGGASGNGGGVLNDGEGAKLSMGNTLVAGNTASKGGSGGTRTLNGGGPDGGALVQTGTPGADGIGFDVAGGLSSSGFNMIGVGDGGSGFANTVKGDHVGSLALPIDPLLAPLQMNGGETPTHALLPGSPAIDQGNSFRTSTDQRGRKRPYNYTSVPNAHGSDGSDIGAFELQP